MASFVTRPNGRGCGAAVMRRAKMCLAAAALASSSALAQVWPSGPVTVVLSNSAGSAPDILLRLVTERLGRSLKQPFNVLNRVGGNGVAAMVAVTRAKPDGYTLSFASSTQLAANVWLVKDLPYDPEKDLVPIAMVINSIPLVIAANPRLPANTFPELIALAKAQPGKLSYSAAGGLPPLFGEMLNKVAGISIVGVTYKDTMQATVETISGLVDLTYQAIPGVEPSRQAGKLKYLAVTSRERFPVLPDLPSVAETLPGFGMSGSFALLGPAGLPQDIAVRLNREVDAVMKDPEIVKRLYQFGFSSNGAGTFQALRAYIREEREFWARVAKELNLQPQ